MEDLRLLPLVHFKIVKVELPAAVEPGVVSEQRCGTVVAVRVNGPMREHNIGMFGLEDLSKIIVARAIQLGVAVNLTGEKRTRFQYFAGLPAFRCPDCGSLLQRCSLYAGLAASEVEDRDFMSLIGVERDGAAASGFGIIRVASHDDDLQLSARSLTRGVRISNGKCCPKRSYQKGRASKHVSACDFFQGIFSVLQKYHSN